MGLKLFVLGSPRLERDGRPVAIGRRKAFSLLVYLAVTGQPHRRDSLAALFWPDYDQGSARAALRRTLASLIKDLPLNVIAAQRDTISLHNPEAGSDLWLDFKKFQQFWSECKLHGHVEADTCSSCIDSLTAAVALYQGDFLSGFTLRDAPDFDNWQFFQAETVRQELGEVLARLVRAYSARKEFQLAIENCRRWLALDPLNEAAHTILISLYAHAGSRQAALRQYIECARLLEKELGIQPRPETTQLYKAIRKNEFSALMRQFGPVGFGQDMGKEPQVGAELHPSGTVPVEQISLLDRMVRGQLVGREREVAHMGALWDRACSGQGSMLLVKGEAGVGKTRLVHELVRLAGDQGAIVMVGQCHAEDGASLAPAAQMIRSSLNKGGKAAQNIPAYILADLLVIAPHLRPRFPGIQPNPSLSPQSEWQRLLESFTSWCEILSRTAPVLLCLEDAHWADSATLLLLSHLASVISEMRLVLVITYRDTEIELAEVRLLKKVVFDLNRQRVTETIKLSRLNREHTRKLLVTLLSTGGEISTEFLDTIYRETEGNPFYVEEVCKGLIEAGHLYMAGGVWRRSDIAAIVIPPTIRAAILSRIEKLPASTRETLVLASVLGREFDFPLLKSISKKSESQLLDALEQASQAQIVTEVSQEWPLRYAFNHALIPFTLRESLSRYRLQRLHLNVAEKIEALHPEDVETLTYHYLAAGEINKSVGYALLAAERAQSIHAYDTAVNYLTRALSLMEGHHQSETRLAVLEQLANIHSLRGDRSEAILLYQEALEIWDQMAAVDKWIAVRLYSKIGETFARLGSDAEIKRFQRVSSTGLKKALKLVEGEPPHPETVRLLAVIANDPRGVIQTDWDSAEQYAREAITIAEQLDAPVEYSAALAALETVYGARGLYRERVQLILKRVELSRDERFRDTQARIDLLCQAGNALIMVGEYARALTYLYEAESAADRIRDVSQQVYALGLQAQCFFGLDQWEEMLQIEDKRLALEAQYGHNRVGVMCFYCGLSANVLALRGEYEASQHWRSIAYNNMYDFFNGPPEIWHPVAHY